MKHLLSIISIMFFSTQLFGQDVRISKGKEDIITIDEQPVFIVKKRTSNSYSLYTVNENEVIFVQFNDNETSRYRDDDFVEIHFLGFDMKIESKEYLKITALSARKSAQHLTKWLLEEDVIDAKGAINTERLKIFNAKYNKDLTNRSFR